MAEVRTLYREAPPQVQTFIRWGLGTAARPAAIIDLHADQVDWVRGVVNLNPRGREQNKEHRPEVRLPKSLSTPFEGHLIQVGGRPIHQVVLAHISVAGRPHGQCLGLFPAPYGGPVDAAPGVPVDEVRQQLGHKVEGTTGVYSDYDPRYLEMARTALDQLVLATCDPTT